MVLYVDKNFNFGNMYTAFVRIFVKQKLSFQKRLKLIVHARSILTSVTHRPFLATSFYSYPRLQKKNENALTPLDTSEEKRNSD